MAANSILLGQEEREVKINIVFDSLQEFLSHLKQLQVIGQQGFKQGNKYVIVAINYEVKEFKLQPAKK